METGARPKEGTVGIGKAIKVRRVGGYSKRCVFKIDDFLGGSIEGNISLFARG